MARNASEFYRGRRKKAGPAVIVPIIVLSLIAFVALLFYGLQKYIVITNDGLYLDLPLLSDKQMPVDDDGVTMRDFEPVDAELVIGEPDYSNVKAFAGENLTDIKAVFVPADMVNQQSVETIAAGMESGNTVMLDAKTVTGMLVWKSGTDIANGYGTSGTVDLKPIVTALHDKELKVAVRLCCFVDNTLASRYAQLALRTSTGAPFSDDNGAWLDPTNTIVKGYIKDLCKELSSMGVDEIVLNGMRMPEAEGVVFDYASTTSAEPTPQTAISGFAISIARSMRSSGTNISVQVGSSTAMESLDTATGQSAELFFKVFDRIYRTSSVSSAADEAAAAEKLVTLGDIKYRYVPMCADGTPDTNCWVDMS